MSKQKLRHEKVIICPYADYNKNGCTHPHCIHLHGQECYLKKVGRNYGKVKSKKHINRKFNRNGL